MKRARVKSAFRGDSSLIAVLQRVEQLYREGKLALLTASQRSALLDRTITRADAFEDSYKKELAERGRKALSL
jgi:hypothetical protein